MIGASVMKELTTDYRKFTEFTESEVKKENKFSCSHNFDFTCIHFNIYECLKWLEKPLWLINIILYDAIVTAICSINTESESQSVLVKMAFLTVPQFHKKAFMSEFFIKKVAGYWLIKKRLQHYFFLMDHVKCFKNTY